MFEQLKEMNAELEQLKKTHLEKSKAMFTKVAKLVFEKHPLLDSFGWRQYTPYFNDGDECTFSARIDDPDINDISGYDVCFKDEYVYDYSIDVPRGQERPKIKNESYSPDLENALQDVREFLANIDEGALRDMFGDHVEVKVSRTGTEVSQYEHD